MSRGCVGINYSLPRLATSSLIRRRLDLVLEARRRIFLRVDGRLQGDVDFAKVAQVAGFITPVPGGVGPMTIASLMQNTWNSYRKKHT